MAPVRVFISYSHDSEEHKKNVLSFSERLRGDGIDARIDQYQGDMPEKGWTRWTIEEVGKADFVLMIFTKTYQRRFLGNEQQNIGKGSDLEGRLILEEVIGKHNRLRKFIALTFTESDKSFIPPPISAHLHYLIGKESYQSLLRFLSDEDRVTPRKLGRLPGLSRTEIPPMIFDGEKTRSDPGRLHNFPEASLLRITVHSWGDHSYEVEVEARQRPGDSYTTTSLRVDRAENPQHLCNIIHEHPSLTRLFKDLSANSSATEKPIRIQLILGPSAYHLEAWAWEKLQWGTMAFAASPEHVFSRQLDNSRAERGELVIRPRTQITFGGVDIYGAPTEVVSGEDWAQPIQAGPHVRRAVGESWVGNDATRHRLEDSIATAEVLHLSLPATSTDRGLQVLLPTSQGLKSQPASELRDFLHRLARNKPSLIILSPYTDNEPADLGPHLAYQLSLARVPAVIAPIGVSDAYRWDEIAAALLADLKEHGIIDLAVAKARHTLQRDQNGDIVLYLRAKSARLWYEPGIYLPGKTKPNSEDDFWNDLGKTLNEADDLSMSSSLVFIGDDFDPEVSWSRRDIARQLAKRSGFALSKRESEDLGTVAEFIQISKQGEREHIKLFNDVSSNYLINRYNLTTRQIGPEPTLSEIVELATKQRIEEESPFEVLSRLKARAFITVYFHDIIERTLRSVGRQPNSKSFCLNQSRSDPQANNFASIEKPLVYHCFGTLHKEQDILLSRTDYLAFFEEFCLMRDPVTTLVRSLMSSSPLIFLGFRSTGENLRMLLKIVRQVKGSYLREKRVHVAVQVDPEDDHTIDPEGARDYYAGQLTGLGGNVGIFWGTPKEFFKELEERCPASFLPPKGESNAQSV